jgi:hypothetical protein
LDAITPEVDQAIRFSSWYEARGLARSTAFKLLAASGLELERRRVEGSRSPVSFVSADHQQKLDFLADQLASGKSLAELERHIVKAQAVSTPPEPEEPVTKPALLFQRLQALELAQNTGMGLTTSEVAWILGVRPGAASIVRGNVLVEKQARNCWTVSPME